MPEARILTVSKGRSLQHKHKGEVLYFVSGAAEIAITALEKVIIFEVSVPESEEGNARSDND